MSQPAHNIPLPPSQEDLALSPPRAPYVGTQTPTNGSDVGTVSPANSSARLPPVVKTERDGAAAEVATKSPRKFKAWYIGAIFAAIVVIVLVVVLPVYFTVIKPKQRNTSAASSTTNNDDASNDGGPGNTNEPEKPGVLTTGGDGSEITADDGSKFTYKNQFGGYWVYDPKDPFNNGARCNSWTPPLNASWTWGKDRVYGVNLGGHFVLEPFISPALFQKYPGAIDEWTLSEAMADDKAGGGLNQLEEHYKTFIVEQDIAEIAGAGLNWVRLPIPFWAINKWDDEPYLEKVSWKYIVRVIDWCRKYGIRVKLDLHTIPGSANAFNHGGKMGSMNFLYGPMGIANAQRAADYMRTFMEFIAQPEYKDVVVMFGIMNEPQLRDLGRDSLMSFNLEMHKILRAITGFGEGNGPYIALHDGFDGLSNWAGELVGADRFVLDFHPYLAFSGEPNDQPIASGTGSSAGGIWPEKACSTWGNRIRNSRRGFGITIAGEFSNGFNDCGLFLRGVRGHSTTPNCEGFLDSSDWSASTKAGIQAFAEASMDALGDWFFWTWRIGKSKDGIVESPLWSYKLGLENGWIPKDPRSATGKCSKVGVDLDEDFGKYKSWQTGGAGAGTIAPAYTAQYPWPPAAIVNANAPVSLLPTYTQTGPIATLPPPTFSPTPTNQLDGWFNSQDTAGAYVTVKGCSYPDPWNADSVPPVCTGDDAAPTPTPTPTEAPARRQFRGRQL